MNTLELAKNIGKTADLRTENLLVTVNILDAKSSYGRIRYLIEPVEGSRQQWVDASRVLFTV